jgi:hypothetical protein
MTQQVQKTDPKFNPFSGIGQAEIKGKHSTIPDGEYVVKINHALYKRTFKGQPIYIVEMAVLEILKLVNPEEDSKKVTIGSPATYSVLLEPKVQAFPKIKGFVYACLGLTLGSPKEERDEVDAAMDETMLRSTIDGFPESENLFGGVKVRLRVITNPQVKDPTKEFTNMYFAPVDDSN